MFDLCVSSEDGGFAVYDKEHRRQNYVDASGRMKCKALKRAQFTCRRSATLAFVVIPEKRTVWTYLRVQELCVPNVCLADLSNARDSPLLPIT